jgi:hypothetical protein
MEPSIRQDFALSICLDNALLATSVTAGEAVPPSEILSLAAGAQAIFITATLESRAFDRVHDHFMLWSELSQLFAELCDSWTNVQSSDPDITWLRGRLEHFRDLCCDRTELYYEGRARRRYVKRKAADSLA